MDRLYIISTEEIIETYYITSSMICDGNASASNDTNNSNNHGDTITTPVTIALRVTTTHADVTIIDNPDEHDIDTYTSSHNHGQQRHRYYFDQHR
jgi:hypothetical protein